MGSSRGPKGISGSSPIVPTFVLDQYPVEIPGEPDSPEARSRPNTPAIQPNPGRFAQARRDMSAAMRIMSTGQLRSRPGGGGPTGGGGGGSGGGGRLRRPSGGGTRRRAQSSKSRVRRALAGYTRALGTPENVARRLGAAVDVGARLFNALDQIARDGIEAALRQLHLDSALGGGPAAMVDAIMTLVCGENTAGSLDESLARHACDEMFMNMYGSGATLETLQPNQVPALIRSFAIEAVYAQIERDIATDILEVPKSEDDARQMQHELRDIIGDSIRLELPNEAETRYTVGQVREAIALSYRDAFQIFRTNSRR